MIYIIIAIIVAAVVVLAAVITLLVISSSKKKANYAKIQVIGGQPATKDNNLAGPNLLQHEENGQGTILI